MNMKNPILLAIVTLALTLALVNCNDDSKPDPECDCTVKAHNAPCECDAAGTPACDCTVIQRTFTDLTFLGKNITLIDRTDGATDLKARGIHKQIQDGLDTVTNPGQTWIKKFNAIHATGKFAIVITSGADYENEYEVEEYEVLFRENQILTYSSTDIGGVVNLAVYYFMTAP